ncbi:glutathione S-transferase family protein [Verticiella sediminum]|nr:glutathione S-transferase family protein [Verticiella sediminum]
MTTTLPAAPYTLRGTLTSPFARKVRIAIDVLGLTDQVAMWPVQPTDPADPIEEQNPLGKYPCLLRQSGPPVYDSSVILELLQDVARSEALLPARGAERIDMLTRTRLADGIIDAGALLIYEDRYHEPAHRSDVWRERQTGKILRALAAFEHEPPPPDRTNAETITLACALGFLDKRQLIAWRPAFPALVAWLDAFARHEPAFGRTAPPAA